MEYQAKTLHVSLVDDEVSCVDLAVSGKASGGGLGCSMSDAGIVCSNVQSAVANRSDQFAYFR